MAASDIDKIVARVLWIIGARSSSFVTTVSDDRFILEEVQRAVIETEAEIVRAVCESYHPMRNQFLTWSNDLSNGDPLPPYIGQIDAVKVEPYSGGADVFAESTSRENIRLWRANTNNIFDTIAHNANGSSLAGYFNITNDTIFFTGHRANVRACMYVPDYAIPSLSIDSQFDDMLVAGTIPRLNKHGMPQQLVMSYGAMYQEQMANIRNGLNTKPDVAQAQKDG